MITIRPESADDIAAIRSVNELAFGQSDEAKLVDALRETVKPFISLVATLEGVVVGHISFTPVRIREATTSISMVSLAPMAVTPSRQRTGIGSQLIRAGLGECRKQGHGLVFVLGHPEYYARSGFQPAEAHDLTCEFPCPPEAFMVFELIPGALRCGSGTIVYPAPFHALGA